MRGITVNKAKRGRQCDRWKIRVSGTVDGSMEKILKNYMYQCDQGEERDSMR
jgi:hypothetical protein